ncbi:hypothetical protein [Sphaerospermopsis torques-reginae]|uniref:Uncharacterized protein n=1 Tax=Sphaerospermopsis torques-reginae ITEP-024 TaxID=984208 RepID=A0ABX8X1D3_9CYAN|nr:hypothetical protein [Sphaerospermopsis torques-reginae]QYX32520.1 hypothetical protein K2F26_03760 [Sphaerospermopsis torques-reginae ITEP-024]
MPSHLYYRPKNKCYLREETESHSSLPIRVAPGWHWYGLSGCKFGEITMTFSEIAALEERRDWHTSQISMIDNKLREYYYSNIVNEEGDVISYADYFDQYQGELMRH